VAESAGPAITGSCLCGGVRFELSELPTTAGYCHCSRCQRRTGAAASAQARIDGRTFKLVAGEDLLQGWRHDDGGFVKCFCRNCGAHLLSHNDDWSQMSIRLSAFDQSQLPATLRPSYRQYVAYAAAWEPIPDDGLERFPESRPRPTFN
jgi:hypothetical protein